MSVLDAIEEDYYAGRITFREALEAYEEFLRDGFEVELQSAWEEGYGAAWEDTLLPPSDVL